VITRLIAVEALGALVTPAELTAPSSSPVSRPTMALSMALRRVMPLRMPTGLELNGEVSWRTRSMLWGDDATQSAVCSL
jgi:hypothetical protein